MRIRKTAAKDYKCLRTLLGHRRVRALKLAGFENMQRLNLHSQCLCRYVSLPQFFLISTRTAMVNHRHAGEIGKYLF